MGGGAMTPLMSALYKTDRTWLTELPTATDYAAGLGFQPRLAGPTNVYFPSSSAVPINKYL